MRGLADRWDMCICVSPEAAHVLTVCADGGRKMFRPYAGENSPRRGERRSPAVVVRIMKRRANDDSPLRRGMSP
jgi:hypothetical protein